MEFGGPPLTVMVQVRRFRCVACGGTTTVAPRGTVRHRHYSAASIGLALALYGLDHAAVSEVRRRVSPWAVVGASAAGRWAALVRWIRAVRRGVLFADVRVAPVGCTLRQIAERAGATLAACAPPTLRTGPLAEQAFLGAVAMV